LFSDRTPLPPTPDPPSAPRVDVVHLPQDDRDPTLLFRAESEMSAAERARLTPASRETPHPSVLPIEVKARHPVEDAPALGRRLAEVYALPLQPSRRDRTIATGTHQPAGRAKAIAVRQPWALVAVVGVAAFAGFLAARPGEERAQAGAELDAVQTTTPVDVVLPAAIPSAAVPMTGSIKTTRPALQAQPQTVRARTAGFIGTLAVESVPPGAAVFVDRQRVGATPIQIPRLRAGSHVIWIEREGYQRWTASVLVPAERLTRVTAKLALESSR